MSWNDLWSAVRAFLDFRLLEVGGTPVTVSTVVLGVIIVAVTFYISRLVQRAITRAMTRRGAESSGSVRAVARLVHYTLVVIGFGIALDTAGINLGALFAAGAVFAVGIGFAMQNIAQNFVSGVILLVERAIKPGDVLEVEGQVVRVREMGIRSTIVRTRDGADVIVPNSTLAQSLVTNSTMGDSAYRIRVSVGVTYSSDMDLTYDTLAATAADLPWRLQEHEPQVLMLEFGDSSVVFEVAVWISDPWPARVQRSQLHRAIWRALKEQGIVIAFPQLDVHLDPPVEEALLKLSA